jgi:hypothetical protein
MSVAFWSVQLKAGKEVEVQPPEGYVLNLQLAALQSQGDNEKCAQVKCDTFAIEGDKLQAVICTLRSKTTDQTSLNLVFGYDVSTKFSFTGTDKSSTVFLSGYYQPAPEEMGSDDEFDGEMPSDGENSDSDSEGDEAPVVKGSKMVIHEEEGSDDGSDLEESSIDEDFIKKMIQQNRTTGGDDEEEDSDEEDSEEEESESEEEQPPAKVQKAAQKSTPQRPTTAPQQKTPQGSQQKQGGNKTPQGGNKNTPKQGSAGKPAFQKSGDKRKR